MNSKCADCGAEECGCDQPPMPAAGPWRYDVENIQDDTYYLCAYRTGFHALTGLVIKLDSRPFKGAFATINPPETPNDSHS